MAMTLAELADLVGASLRGDGGHQVCSCAGLDEAGPEDVSFLSNYKYIKKLATTQAGAVVISPEGESHACGQNLLVSEDPYFAFREAVVALHGYREQPGPGISDRAVVDPTAQLGEGCCIQPFAVVEAGARIGRRCVLYPHTYVGPEAVIGDDCLLFASVTVYDRCVLGNRVTIHAGSVIGQDGFGYATHGGMHQKIPQIGNVVIEDDVEIGANCAIDRATVGSTRIGQGSKFSDLVTIGHGANIGPHNLLVAQVGVAGSVQTGKYVAMGGQAGVAGHLKIGDMAQLAAQSGVMADVPDKALFGGMPAIPLMQAKRNVLIMAKLPRLLQQVKQMQKQIEALQARLDDCDTGESSD